MSNLSRNKPNINATYFREHGIHSVPNGELTDHIVSFPTWEDTAEALKNNLPQSGRIITPEYATLPDDVEDITQSAALIRERLQFAKELSRQTEAEIHLGTPYRLGNTATKEAWHNSVITLKGGMPASIAHKTMVLPVEQEMGIQPYPIRDRVVRDGRAVLICAELYDFPYKASSKFKEEARDIIVPANWSIPARGEFDDIRQRQIENAGGEDNYYRMLLEQAVTQDAFARLPNLDRITVADRGHSGNTPYNAVFERVPTEKQRAA